MGDHAPGASPEASASIMMTEHILYLLLKFVPLFLTTRYAVDSGSFRALNKVRVAEGPQPQNNSAKILSSMKDELISFKDKGLALKKVGNHGKID